MESYPTGLVIFVRHKPEHVVLGSPLPLSYSKCIILGYVVFSKVLVPSFFSCFQLALLTRYTAALLRHGSPWMLQPFSLGLCACSSAHSINFYLFLGNSVHSLVETSFENPDIHSAPLLDTRMASLAPPFHNISPSVVRTKFSTTSLSGAASYYSVLSSLCYFISKGGYLVHPL